MSKSVKNQMEQLMVEVSLITASGLPMMEGKEHLETKKVLDEILTVDEYGYMEGDDGEYAVISLQEYPDKFIYGSSVVTQAFKTFDEKFDAEQRKVVLESGLTFKLEELVSKNKRTYTKITFFPKE